MRIRGLPTSAIAALAGPVLAGLGWMALAGAPGPYLIVNSAALALALACALWLRVPDSRNAMLALGIGALALLAATIPLGPEVGGVRRWLTLGPVQVHAGYLALPLLAVLASRLPDGFGAGLLLATLAICAAQPDLAIAVALAVTLAALALLKRDWIYAAAFVISALVCSWLVQRPDPLEPVRFVERVQLEAFFLKPWAGVLLGLAGLLPTLLLLTRKLETRLLAAFLLAAGFAALVGPYPSILIGYGASPILGFGLALAAIRET